ncbi:MAG TPA: 4-vinyl reductase [Anaerolineae bacterium]|nr:4-vinyl reductase [Anaerolineae bacterium]
MEETLIPFVVLSVLIDEARRVLGRRGLIALLRRAGLDAYVDAPPPSAHVPPVPIVHWAQLVAAVHDAFDPRAAHDLLWRAGESASIALRRPTPARVAGTALRLLPADRRLRLALERLAAQGEDVYGTPHHLEEEPSAFFVTLHACPHCSAVTRRMPRPVCHTASAWIADSVEWAMGEKHLVEEVACIAAGGVACRFRVAR